MSDYFSRTYGLEQEDPVYGWRVAITEKSFRKLTVNAIEEMFKLEKEFKYNVNKTMYIQTLVIELTFKGLFQCLLDAKQIGYYAGNGHDTFVYILNKIKEVNPHLLTHYFAQEQGQKFLRSVYALKEFITRRLVEFIEKLCEEIGYEIPSFDVMPLDNLMERMGYFPLV